MLSIGIDVSKGKSTVCGMKPGGEIVYAPFEVQHTRKEMSELVLLLHSSGEEVRAVLESTGSYHCPVVAALLENGIFVSVVNSLRMKRFCSQSIRKVKTDRIDAMQIALYGLAYWQELQPTRLPEDTYPLLKNFPASEKFSLCQEIKQSCYKLIRAAVMANNLTNVNRRLMWLDEADAEKTLLLVLLGVAKNQKYITQKKLLELQGKLEEIGRIIGGLQKFFINNRK